MLASELPVYRDTFELVGLLVLMKVDNYEKLFPLPMALELTEEREEEVEMSYPYPTYDSQSEGFDVLLSSANWTGEEEQP